MKNPFGQGPAKQAGRLILPHFFVFCHTAWRQVDFAAAALHISRQTLYNEDEMTQEEWKAEGQRVLREAARALDRLADRLDAAAWAEAVELILQTKGRVVVSGMGKSGTVGMKLAATLSSTGTPAQFLHPAEGVHGDLGMLQAGDTVLTLSYSGETDEMLAILPALRQRNLPMIAMTGRPHSTLGRAASVVLDAGVEREACSIGLAPTTSTTAMITLGDALAVSVMAAREFTPEQYSRLHPAGTLGRRLTLRVADVMRTGEAVAVVPDDCTVLDAMLSITQAHAGAAIIVGSSGKVMGLLTDGDVRRAFAGQSAAFVASRVGSYDRKPRRHHAGFAGD